MQNGHGKARTQIEATNAAFAPEAGQLPPSLAADNFCKPPKLLKPLLWSLLINTLELGAHHRVEAFPEETRQRSGLSEEFFFAPRAGDETVNHTVAALAMLLVGLIMH